MIWKRKLRKPMILQRSSTGDPQPILTFRYLFDLHCFFCFLDLDAGNLSHLFAMAVGKIPGGTGRNEEHEQARVRCPLEKVLIIMMNSFIKVH